MTTTPESGVIVDDESRVVPRCSNRSVVVVVLSISITDDKGQLIAAGNGDIVNGSYWNSAAAIIIVLTAHTTFSLLHHTG